MPDEKRDEHRDVEETELEQEQAQELPDREMLSIVDAGESLGAPPIAE